MTELFQHSKWTIAQTIAGVVIGLVISVLSARTLGAEGRGIYTLALLVMSTVGLFLNPGLYAAANYYVASRRLSRRDAFQTSLILCTPFTILSFAIGPGVYVLLLFSRQGTLELASAKVGLLIGIGASSVTVGSTMAGVLIGAKLIREAACVGIVSAVVQVLAGTGYVLFHESHSALFFIALFAGAKLLEAISYTLLAGRDCWTGMTGMSVDLDNCRNFLAYGSIVHIGRVLLVGAQRSDAYIVFLLAGQAALGVYSIASTVSEQLWLLPTAVSMVMMANVAHLRIEDASEITSRASQTVALLALVSAGLLGLVGSGLIPLVFGAEFGASVAPFVIMLPGMVAVSIYPILEPFFQSQHRPWIPIRITVLGALSNILLCLLLIPRFGILGAAGAYSLSYGIQTALTCHTYSRFTNRRFVDPIDIFDAGQHIFASIRDRLLKRQYHAVAKQD